MKNSIIINVDQLYGNGLLLFLLDYFKDLDPNVEISLNELAATLNPEGDEREKKLLKTRLRNKLKLLEESQKVLLIKKLTKYRTNIYYYQKYS